MTRLVLWDIDGTLVRAGNLGAEVFDRAVLGVLGRLPEQRVVMGGKTDPQIVHEYLQLLHVEDPSTLPEILRRLEEELAAVAHLIAAQGWVCPGIGELLPRLDAEPGIAQSVLTGNIAPNAVVKLAAFGLDRWLDLKTGAYGSDHADRRQLVPIALHRQRELRGREIGPGEVWVVGDTPSDLACARAGGARCLLVATGRPTIDELEPLGADALLADLTDTEAVVALLTG
jgi:phosphoglycolate phosphatase-like HAD superfamily hydrolase